MPTGDDIDSQAVKGGGEILSLFISTGALLEGHFQLSSGLHSRNYLQCALLLQHPDVAERLGRSLADHFRNLQVSAVVAPAIGGIIVAHEVARALGVRALFTERENGVMTLRRGFSVTPGERVLVVEDVVTTGGSTRDTIEAVSRAEGQVVGAGSMVDRSGGAADVGVARAALLTLTVPAYDPAECPLCRDGVPAVKPGSRKPKS
ncbi:MAG: orotate phosphoribosyltransferase [Blastocatellia bacterium]